MNITNTTAARWQDWASFTLGLWLALSPWIVGYTEHESATGNAVFLGLALALGCHFEAAFDEVRPGMDQPRRRPVAGDRAFRARLQRACPSPTANSIAVGSLVAVLAGSALSLDKEIGKLLHRRTADHSR